MESATLEVRDLKILERGDFALAAGTVTIIAGGNGSGKTATCVAAGAAVCGVVQPVAKLTKDQTSRLVRKGADFARATLVHDGGRAEIRWPKPKPHTEGRLVTCSQFAVGLKNFLRLKDEEQAKLLVELLKAEPDEKELTAALKDIRGIEDATVAETVKDVKAGWDRAWEIAKNRGQKFKGEYRAASGQEWGSKQSANWMPEGFDLDTLGKSRDTLEAELAQAKADHEETIRFETLSENELASLRESTEKIPEITPKVEEAKKEKDAAQTHLEAAQKVLQALPRPTEEQITANCTHCGKPNVIAGLELQKPVELDAAENGKRSEALKRQHAVVQEHRQALNDATTCLISLENALKLATQAKTRLAELEAMPARSLEVPDVEKSRQRVTNAERRLKQWDAKTAADRLHAQIMRNQQIIDLLAPDGLRQTKLRKALQDFNAKVLAKLCKAAGYPPIEIHPDLSITYGGLEYFLISEAEEQRVEYVMQIALALLDKSELIVCDRADHLDQPGKVGLIKMLKAIKLPALIAMKMDAQKELESLSIPGTRRYWLADGVATELSKELVTA